MRTGIGYDVHKMVEGRKLILGGVEIPHHKGLLGHSDADVLIHAIMDSILGALADTDMQYKDISSMVLLEKVHNIMKEHGYEIGNIDSIVVAQEPKFAPYIDSMRENIAKALETSKDNIGVKATTTEWLGFEGRKEGISSHAICLLKEL